MQRQAAELLMESGQMEADADLFRQAEDWQGLIRLLVQHAKALFEQGRNATLQQWLVSVPPALR